MLPFNLSFRELLRKFIPQVSPEQIDRHERLIALRHSLVHELDIIPENNIAVVQVLCFVLTDESFSCLEESECSENTLEQLRSIKDVLFEGESAFVNYLTGTLQIDEQLTGQIIECAEQREKLKQVPGDDHSEEPYKERIKKQIQITGEEASAIFQDFKDEFNAIQKRWIAQREFALEQGNYLQIPTNFGSLRRYFDKWLRYVRVVCSTIFTLRKNQVKYFLQTCTLMKAVIILAVIISVVSGVLAIMP